MAAQNAPAGPKMTAKATFRRIHALCWTLILAGAVAVAMFNISPWPLLLIVLVLLIVTIAQRTSWTLAVAASLLVGLTALALLLQLTPHLKMSLETSTMSALAIGGLALILVLSSASKVRYPSQTAILFAAPAVIVPIIFVALASLGGFLGTLGYSWAMQNDATWNLVVARFVMGDGGIDPALHANSSPLAPILIAVSASLGRGSVVPSALLTHDVSRAAELWIVLGASGAALAGLIAVQATRNFHFSLRWLAGIATSCIPLAWFTFGYSLEFGFYNASIALVILLAAWIAWREFPRFPVAACTTLLVALVASLAAWGPLAIIIVALLALAFGSLRRDRFRFPTVVSLIAPVIAAAAAGAYGLLVTLPDLRREGAALSANGGIFDLTFPQSALIGGVTAGIVFFAATFNRDRNLFGGMLAVTLGGASGILLLVMQRTAGMDLWGYYPVKFSWMLISLLFVISTAVFFSAIGNIQSHTLVRVILLTVGAGTILALAWQMPPRFLPSVKNIFPPANILTGTGVARLDPAARNLFEISSDDQPAIAFRLHDPEQDQFVNTWLLQIHSKTSADPVRYWAYYLDPQNESHLCQALLAWDTAVVIHTSDDTLGTRIQQSCIGATFSIALEVIK